MPDNKEAMIFQLEADDSGVKKTILDVETAAKGAADSVGTTVKKTSEKVKANASETSKKVYSDIASNNSKIKSILDDTEKSLRGKAASISQVYRSEGMNQSDAMKKAWEQIERSSSGAAAKVKKHSGSTSGQVKKDMGGVAKSAKASAREMKSTAAGTASSIGSSFSSMAKKIGLAMAAAFSVTKIVSFGKECLSLGSSLSEVVNVVETAFPNMQSELDEFAKNAAKNFGLSELTAKQYAGTFGIMAEAFGFSEQSAYDMAESLTGLAGDIASFYDKTADESYTMLKSIFTGETETLKNIGVVMTQSALDAYALANGYGKTTSKMSEMEKVSLRYAFVQDQLAKAQGDYARTSDGWANSTRSLSESFKNLKSQIGQGLINVFSPVVSWLNTIIERLTTAAKKFKEFTASIMGIPKDADKSDESSAIVSTELLNSSLGETETSAKKAAKAMRDLMGFDEINRLSDNSADTGAAATSAPAVSASGTDQNENKNKDTNVSALEGPLKRIKALWDELCGSFKKGLKTRLEAGNVTAALDNIKKNLFRIKDTLQEIFTDSGAVNSAKYMLDQIAEYYGSRVGNFLSIGANLAAAFTQGIADFLDEKKEFLKEKITSIFETTGDIFGSLTEIMNDVTDIINHILQLPETAKVIADAINIVITPLLTGVDLVLKFVRDNLAGLAKVIHDNKEGFMKIGEDIMGFISDITGAISEFVDTVCAKAEEVYTLYIKPAIDNIWEGVNNLVSFLIGIWQEYISPFLQELGEDIGGLFREHIAPLAEKVIEFLGKAAELISVLWKQFIEPFIEWWVSNIAPVIMPILREIWAVVKLVFGSIIDHIKRVFEILGGLIDFLIGVFTGDWDRAWQGIKEIFSGVVGLFTDKLKNLTQFLGDTFDNVTQFLGDAFENVKTTLKQIFDRAIEIGVEFGMELYRKIKEKFDLITAFFKLFWDNIKQVFSDPKGYFKEKFAAAANGIKEAFHGIKEWFSNLWDDIVTALKAPVNSIIDILNYLIGKINTLSFEIPDWVPEFGGQTFGFNIPAIPHLAAGGYVKANTPQLAVIGDNKREGEIVAPESKIAEAVAKAMQMVLSRLDTAGGAEQPQGETVLQANIWLGNDLLAKKLTKLQKINDYRSGGLA